MFLLYTISTTLKGKWGSGYKRVGVHINARQFTETCKMTFTQSSNTMISEKYSIGTKELNFNIVIFSL